MPLVSSPDGTHAFGAMDGVAMFHSQPPTITMPPYTEVDFPLTQGGGTPEDLVVAALKSLRQPPTPLNTAFFSRANVDGLHRAIQAGVFDKLGVAIERQSDASLLGLMRRFYLETAANWPEDVGEEVARLNSMVLQTALAAVSRNVTQYMAYRTYAQQPVPMLKPAEMLTSPPEYQGTPAPLPNLNAQFAVGLDEVTRTLNPVPPTPTTQPLWGTTPPREARLNPRGLATIGSTSTAVVV